MKSLFTALHLATGAGPALTLLLALVILLFHIWASRRSPGTGIWAASCRWPGSSA